MSVQVIVSVGGLIVTIIMALTLRKQHMSRRGAVLSFFKEVFVGRNSEEYKDNRKASIGDK